jgi:hypothetical protein
VGKYSNVVDIDLGGLDAELAGKLVRIKPRRTYGDGQAIGQATRSALIRDADGNYRALPQDIAAGNFKAMELAIVEWPEDEFGPLPACRCADVQSGDLAACPRIEVIAELDEDAGNWLLDQIEEVYRQHRRSPAAKSGAAAGRPRARRGR